MAFEALNNAGIAGADLLVVLNDNEMSISEPVGALQQLSRAPPVVALLQHDAPRRQGSALEVAAGQGPREALGRAHEGHGAARHAVRGVRLQLHRADRRPRRRGAGAHTRQRQAQLKGPQLLHVVTRKGYGYARAEEDPILYHGVTKFDPAVGIRAEAAGEARLYAGVRRLAVRHGRARRSARRHHAGDARGLGPRALLAGISGALFRRRHRRAARGDVRGRSRVRGHEARRRDLFDVPAARLRPADPRRRAAEPPGGVRDRPRRHRRRRRRDPHRRASTSRICAASPT